MTIKKLAVAILATLVEASPISWREQGESGLLPRDLYIKPIRSSAIFQADIRADTNRDGEVDTKGDSDVVGKGTWTKESGAIFLANIGDTGQRCAKLLENSEDSDQFARCHDASDDTLRDSQYMARLQTIAIPDLGSNASGTVEIVEPAAKPLVRLFRSNGKDNSWEIITKTTVFNKDDLSKGLSLGIDARDTRRPGGWDGRATVQFTVADGKRTSTDKVMLRVAPVLTHHHGQKVQQIFSGAEQAISTLDEIDAVLKTTGSIEPLTRIPSYGVGFMQDMFEPGYMSMPGPEGPVSIRIMLRSSKWNGNPSDYAMYLYIRKSGIGGIQTSTFDDDFDLPFNGAIDWTGNIETIPPYKFGNKTYPLGRVILGGVDGTDNIPHITNYFRAQEIQDPVIVDSTWLNVKHVDEFIQFLPSKSPRGWVLMINDPMAGLDIIKKAAAGGLGKQPLISRKDGGKRKSIDEFLKDEGNLKAATTTAERIQAVVAVLKKETGLENSEIYRLPALYAPEATVESQDGDGSLGELDERSEAASEGNALDRRRQGGFDDYLPACINGIVLDESRIIAPNPFGPWNATSNTDIFQEAVKDVYTQVGYTVDFVDDWDGFHRFHGDVHCGTNTLREIPRL